MSSNPFVLSPDSYVRTINPIGDYVEQVATYLALQTGKSIEECRTFTKTKLRDKTFPQIRDPKIRFYERQENGDRIGVDGTLGGYISASLAAKDLIAPSMTTYINPDIKESLLVSYIDDNVKGRSIAKKAMFVAKAAGNKDLEIIKNTEQTNRKLSNNAISGAHVSKSTPLANKTAHSTLTSNCRSTSGYGNANNEKLLTGNRHYWNASVTLNNIVSIVSHSDYAVLQETMDKYNLHYPTVEETMECIEYSSKLYWTNKTSSEKIKELLEKLSPIQRAAFVYTGDLYHLRKHNSALIYAFVDKLSTKIEIDPTIDDAFGYVKQSNEDQLNLAHQICAEEMKGKGKDYAAIKGTKELTTLAATTAHIFRTITEYSDFIKAFLVTNNMPASVAYFPESIRRSALTSDTDSTIFTAEEWVQWFTGSYAFNDKANSIGSTMIYLASQAITHILAMMSANFGIQQKRLFQIAMKNEFKFDVFVPTNVAKHYYAAISCQEGNVFKEDEYEIKGVHLKSSNSPKSIVKKASTMMENIMKTVKAGEKIKITNILKEIADTERNIFESIKSGDLEFFRLAEIKKPDAYVKSAEESPYGYHMFWMETMSAKYGVYSEPPYQAIRIATTLDNPTLTKEWMENMEDKELSARIKDWFIRNDKVKLPSLLIPVEAIKVNGIPKEIIDIIDIRKIVYNLCKIFYLILETLGFYICNDSITKLVSDFY